MYTIGIDLGGTNIAAGIVNDNYEIIQKDSVPTGADRPGEEIVKDMAALCKKIIADAGLTVYTAGTVKRIPGYKNYVSVDGGMTDNPRYALYESAYTLFCANRMDEERDFLSDVVGRLKSRSYTLTNSGVSDMSIELYTVN